MATIDLINIMKSRYISPAEFDFDILQGPSVYNLFTQADIEELYRIATSLKLSSKLEKKKVMIDEIMTRRGFVKFNAGTNRIVYKFLEDQSFLAKVAIDRVGLSDNPAEYVNQNLLKPFVTKVFSISHNGVLGLVERVQPIVNPNEFLAVANDVFDMITNKIIGKYVLEDIGVSYFMNFGIRTGFGPVLLDYPYLYELDGNKLYCTKEDPVTLLSCDGEIDYDEAYDKLICKKCGKRYMALELGTSIKNKDIEIRKEQLPVKIAVNLNGKRFILGQESDTIQKPQKASTIKTTDDKSFKVALNKKIMKPLEEREVKRSELINSMKLSLSVNGVKLEDETSKKEQSTVVEVAIIKESKVEDNSYDKWLDEPEDEEVVNDDIVDLPEIEDVEVPEEEDVEEIELDEDDIIPPEVKSRDDEIEEKLVSGEYRFNKKGRIIDSKNRLIKMGKKKFDRKDYE